MYKYTQILINIHELYINIHTYSNRGTSGIDGNISTALGIGISSSEKSNFLIIGDQAFMHDIGSLRLLKKLEVNLTIIIINNMGGAIFDHLNLSNSNTKKSYQELIRCTHFRSCL